MIFFIPTNTCFWIWCFLNKLQSYKNLYSIKNRSYDKPLAIFIKDFKFLETISDLLVEQINFLKNYDKPFTILIDISKIHYEPILENINKLPNWEKYSKLAFRIAHNDIQKKLISSYWPFFLTSANRSWNAEIKSTKDIYKQFKYEIQEYDIKIFSYNNYVIDSFYDFSHIFEFVWDGLQLNYIRR